MDCRRVGLIMFTLVLAAATLLHSATAETYTVLGRTGWSIPSTGNDAAYRTWAADKKFQVGDVLVFNFPMDAHDVTEVTKANYDSCGKENIISQLANGPARVNLTTAGMHYFICTFGQHCTAGQKLAVNVTAAPHAVTSPPGTTTPAATPPSTSTTPTTTTSSPPLPSSASSITFGGFSVALLSIVLVFLH